MRSEIFSFCSARKNSCDGCEFSYLALVYPPPPRVFRLTGAVWQTKSLRVDDTPPTSSCISNISICWRACVVRAGVRAMCVVCVWSGAIASRALVLSRPLPPPPPCHCYCRDAAAATLGARFPKLRDTTRSAAVPSLNARAVGPWRRPCVGISRASSSAVRAHRAQPGPDRRLLCCPNHRRPRRRPRRRRHRPARHLARERPGSCVCGVARARRPCRGSTGWRGMRTATSARAVRTGFRKGITRAVARREAPLETFPGNRVRGSRGLRVCVAIGASTASGIGSKVRLVAHPHHPECDWRLDEPPKLHPASKPCRGVKRRILCVNKQYPYAFAIIFLAGWVYVERGCSTLGVLVALL